MLVAVRARTVHKNATMTEHCTSSSWHEIGATFVHHYSVQKNKPDVTMKAAIMLRTYTDKAMDVTEQEMCQLVPFMMLHPAATRDYINSETSILLSSRCENKATV